MLSKESVAPDTGHPMNALSSSLGILIAAVAFWGTVQNLTKAPHQHVRAVAEEAPARAVEHDDSVRVRGRVVDTNGDPVPGVMVVVRLVADTQEELLGTSLEFLGDVVTDATGQFVLSEMIPGNYSVVAIHGKHPPGLARLVVVEDDCQRRMEIVLDRADELISA